jgi:hypothetical protein
MHQRDAMNCHTGVAIDSALAHPIPARSHPWTAGGRGTPPDRDRRAGTCRADPGH